MQLQTLLLLLLAALVALAIVGFQYFYKSKKSGKTIIYLAFFRFLALFGLFSLLINPKFTKNNITIEKSNLVVLVDNSSSVKPFESAIRGTLDAIKSNADLQEKFNIQEYKFGKALRIADSLTFNDKQTDVSQALNAVSGIYNNANTAVLLLTDGNQTLGQDYEFYANKYNYPVFPIAIGDTTQYEDVYIHQVNTNKYAFLKNKFPIEFYVSYEGEENKNIAVSISMDGNKVFSTQIQFNSSQKSKRINTFLEANSIGVKKIGILVESLSNEKNTNNNSKTVAVEVIDEKTNIGLVSAISHPDIGAFVKAIESNEQRSVRLIKPDNSLADLDEIDIFILYQPDVSFKAVYDFIQNKKASVLVVEGPKTDLNFLNRAQKSFQIETGYPIQEVFPTINPSFNFYDISDFKTDDFPPLLTKSGSVSFTGANQTLLQMQIRGIDLQNTLFGLTEADGAKTALFLGEGIWKWRLQSFRNDRNFENFDQFIGKLLLFLSDNKKKNRLDIVYQPIYEGATDARISATYFDETFVFDANAAIILKLNNNKEIPMLVKNGYYEADLSDLIPGDYSFTAQVSNTPILKSGKFTILDFDVENQFFSTDDQKLEKLAQITKGSLIYPNQTGALLSQINSDTRFIPIQKSNENVVSLIDFQIILIIIIAALSAEWFIRKFNGLT